MTRPKNTEERRAEITAALRRVMALRGYDGATIARVAREAGLTPGLVHYHFGSKLEILLALVDGLVAEHTARLDARVAGAGDDPRARLGAYLDAHLATGRDAAPDALGCWLAITGEALRQPQVAERFERGLRALLERLARIIDDGARAGQFFALDRAAAAAAILAAIQGYYVLGATARALIPRGSAARAARRMAEGVLGKETSW